MHNKNEMQIKRMITKTPPPTSPTFPHDTNSQNESKRIVKEIANLFEQKFSINFILNLNFFFLCLIFL